MKKTIAGVILLVAPSVVLADAPGGPNCGWGNLLLEGKSGAANHLLALTTNGTSGNQTFGMSSGTNGCSTKGRLTYGGNKAMISFHEILPEFSEDVAKGHGDALNAVAAMMGVEAGDRAAFAQVTHAHFQTLFPNKDVTAEAVLTSLNTILKQDPRLSKYAAA